MSYSAMGQSNAQACNCMGRQPGMPACPCMMRNFIQRDGRWIRPEQDMGPVSPAAAHIFTTMIRAAGK